MEPPWHAHYSGGPNASSAAEEVTEKLTILATAIQESNTTVNSNVQQIVNEYTAPIPTSKGLKSAVDKMDKARKRLKEAEKARLTMHKNWRKYIADSIERWTQFAEKFGRDDQDLAEKVKAAKEKLQQTKEDVDAKKAALEEHDDIEEVFVSDEEMPEKVDASESIQANLATMVSSLQSLQRSAEAAIVEEGEKHAKRPCTELGGEVPSPSLPSAPGASLALQPFGKPGK